MSEPQPTTPAVTVHVPGPRAVVIESDGTPQGTLITDAATGELLRNIQRIELVIDVHDVARLTLTQVRVPTTITMEAQIKEVTLDGKPLTLAGLGSFGPLEL